MGEIDLARDDDEHVPAPWRRGDALEVHQGRRGEEEHRRKGEGRRRAALRREGGFEGDGGVEGVA